MSSWLMLRKAQQSTFTQTFRRFYGVTTTGARNELAPYPRGYIPGPRTNWLLVAAGFGTLIAAATMRKYAASKRDGIVQRHYDEWQENGHEHWRDFDNLRMPKNAKVLAAGPCGETFQEAYLCAVFGEGAPCEEKFSGFLDCVKSKPEMVRETQPDGSMNWSSKLFLHAIKKEKKKVDALFASVGPAEEDMEDILNNYRARHVLGKNATEAEVTAFKEKFNALKDEFYGEIDALFEGEKTDTGKVDGLYKEIKAKYSIPMDIWLQVMRDYDIEEFDEHVSKARRDYGAIAHIVHFYFFQDKLLEGNMEGVSCGDFFTKFYKCLKDKTEPKDCADAVDELYFCRQQHHKEVWPQVKNFFTLDESYKKEMERISETVTYAPAYY